MKIFISWSGQRSEALAKALREWFPLVLHYVEPWLSQSDIEAGERWGIEVAKELESSNFGVICVTRENLSSPWLLFEAGALAKSMQDGRVIPRHISEGRRDPIFILMVASSFRDAAPWLYELALEAYRAMKSGKGETASRAYHKFVASIDILKDGPFGEELGIDRKLIYVARDALHEFGMVQYDEDHEKPRPLRKIVRAPVPSKVENL